MWFVGQIVSRLCSVRDQFYDAYKEVIGWIFPFWYLAYPLYYLYIAFYYLALYFGYWGDWVDDTVKKLATFFTWSNLEQWFKDWKTKILDAWNWVRDAWSNITRVTGDWWAGVKPTVQGWISAATEGLAGLRVAWSNFWNVTWPQWMSKLDALKAAWDNFWKVTFPTLISKIDLDTWWGTKQKEIDQWKDSWFKDYTPFWAGWIDVKNSVIEFINDPLEWLWGRFADWFLGPERK